MIDVIEESGRLHTEVQALIARGRSTTRDEVDALGLRIARHQSAHVAPVRKLFAARGVDLAKVESIDALPALPCDVFRLKRVAAHPPEADVRVFRTSGTTGGRRGEHCFRDLATYEAAALAMGATMLWPASGARPARVVSLAPRAVDLADSSLSFMIDLFAAHLGVATSHHLGPRGIEWDALLSTVDAARRAHEPILLFGTSFAFVYLLDGGAGRELALPEGSRLMLTGGFKGRSREVSEPELRAALTERLGLSAGRVVGEYGMTELSSQLYEPRLSGGGGHYRAPPWTRVTAVDPVTFEPVAPGEEGLCRIVDLANVDSAIAIQTLDRVRIVDGAIELLGRAKGADARGCSLTVEELAGEPAV